MAFKISGKWARNHHQQLSRKWRISSFRESPCTKIQPKGTEHHNYNSSFSLMKSKPMKQVFRNAPRKAERRNRNGFPKTLRSPERTFRVTWKAGGLIQAAAASTVPGVVFAQQFLPSIWCCHYFLQGAGSFGEGGGWWKLPTKVFWEDLYIETGWTFVGSNVDGEKVHWVQFYCGFFSFGSGGEIGHCQFSSGWNTLMIFGHSMKQMWRMTVTLMCFLTWCHC